MDDVEEVRDESDQEGIRLVIEMKPGGNAKKLLEELYAKTALEAGFSYNMVALVEGRPIQMSLKDMIVEYTRHKQEVIKRRTQYDLKKAEDRKHIVEGLVVAIQNIDDTIKIIKKSRNANEAKDNLVKKYGFSKRQTQAILEVRLQRLTAFDIKALNKELKELEKLVEKYKKILSSEKNILKELKKELNDLKRKHADERKTVIGSFDEIKVSKEVNRFTLQINDNGTIKKLAASYKGSKGLLLKTDSTKTIMVFTEDGEVIVYTGLNLPDRMDKKAVFACNSDDFDEDDVLVFATSDGMVKKTLFKEYRDLNGSGKAIKLNDGARLAGVVYGSVGEHAILVSNKGFVIRFDHSDIRCTGRISMGVKGIQLEEKDFVKYMFLVQADLKSGKVAGIELKNVKIQNRGGKGSKAKKNLN
jgi:DNA gyrase subunit A